MAVVVAAVVDSIAAWTLLGCPVPCPMNTATESQRFPVNLVVMLND